MNDVFARSMKTLAQCAIGMAAGAALAAIGGAPTITAVDWPYVAGSAALAAIAAVLMNLNKLKGDD